MHCGHHALSAAAATAVDDRRILCDLPLPFVACPSPLTPVTGNVLPIVLLDQTEQCLGIITASIPALTAWLSRPYRVRHGPDDQGPRGDPYDFLSFAYDPDRQNMGCYATAYSEHVYVLDDLLGGAGDKNGDSTERLNLGVITTTTTVTVDISRKSA